MSLDWRGNLEETPKARVGHANSAHIQGGGGNQTPNHGEKKGLYLAHFMIVKHCCRILC